MGDAPEFFTKIFVRVLKSEGTDMFWTHLPFESAIHLDSGRCWGPYNRSRLVLVVKA